MDYFWGYSHSTEYLGCKITSSPLHLIRDLHSSSAFNLKVVDYSKIVSHLSFNVSFYHFVLSFRSIISFYHFALSCFVLSCFVLSCFVLSFNVSFKFEAPWVGIELARCEAPACDDGA